MSETSRSQTCKSCFPADSTVINRSHKSRDQAILELTVDIAAGLLPCMCQTSTGQFNVCYENPVINSR